MATVRRDRGPNTRDFYRFFCQGSSDGRAAVVSVVAGTIGGGVLVIAMAGAGIVAYLSSSSISPRPLVLFAIALCSVIATWATWRRVISGAVINALMGLSLTAWLCFRGEVAIAVIIFVPTVCGSITGARGAYVLNNLTGQQQ
jgi:hypothetical protein